MNRQKWIALLSLASLLLLLAIAGCGKKATEDQSTSESKAGDTKASTPIDKSTVASVSGTAKFEGTAPKAQKLDMSQDPACAKMGKDVTSETVVADNGNLANVFVYVKEGLGARTFDVPKEKVTLDQRGCRYVPHVLGVMAGQTVEILNSDDTTHNIHPSPKDNKEWNESQPPKGAPLDKNFARQEVLIPVKCNQHPWMKMYLGVVKHPYFVVTGKDGSFTIKDLPPGDYTLAAVHEKYGEQTMKLTVQPKTDVKDHVFTFKTQ